MLYKKTRFQYKPTAKIVWLGGKPFVEHLLNLKGNSGNDDFDFHEKESFSIQPNIEGGRKCF
jgi:hypothetical protein